jgi:iron complex transport system substrate-binding protein
MNICSLLPAATEIICRLGLEDQITGVTHECDFPPGVRVKTILTRCAFDSENMNPAEIDDAVRSLAVAGKSLYEIDDEKLRRANPDLIVTQDLCHVCAITPGEVERAMQSLEKKPKMISLNPKRLADVFADFHKIGDAAGASSRAIVMDLEARVEKIKCASDRKPKPTVGCIEWLQPLWQAGHWIPEMIQIAGAEEVLASPGEPSRSLTWEELEKADPDVVVIMPCGYDLERTRTEFLNSQHSYPWTKLKAFQKHQIFLVDANSYFSRPGPRLVDGLEILAEMLHAEYFAGMAPYNSYTRIV